MISRIDDKLIDSIVAEVLAQLRQQKGSAPPEKTNGQSTGIVELSDAVITAEVVEKNAKANTSIHVPPRAILTPAARDYLKAHNIRLQQSSNSATPSRPANGLIIAALMTPVVKDLIADVKKHSDAWRVEMESGNSDIVAKAQSSICRGDADQVLVFAKSPHEIACRVNRNASCRAAVVRDAAGVRTVREEFPANVLCIELKNTSFMTLKQTIKASEETKR